ncbi:MAG TPA: hypothetical protein VFH99_01030 [Candidatus Saccharimonadales bacterium]|nr:hypothetical protein [Candidatus Saccharimonadales bacterium]
MADQIQQTRQANSDGTASVRTTKIVDNDNDQIDSKDSIASRIVWFIGGVIAILLAFRFVFILFGASNSNGFASFIYSVSHPFASPFFGLFSYKQQYGEARFELSTLVAIIVYLLIAYGIGKLLTIRRPR